MKNEIEKTLLFLFVILCSFFLLIDPSIVSDFQSTTSLTNNHNHNQNDEKEGEEYEEEEKLTSTI